MSLRRVAVFVVAFNSAVTLAAAQPLGTFRWQIQPYCNVLTLSVVQQGGNFTLDGTDDRCGMSRSASAVGIAYFNPNGSISFGVTEVMPGGLPIHIDATIDLSSLNGTWRDSGGSTGSFIFTPGASIGGPLRSVPSAGIAPGTITTVQLAPSAVGSGQIAANAVNGSNVLDGSLTQADIGDAPRVASVEIGGLVGSQLADFEVAHITVLAPAAGYVLVNASGSFVFGDYNTTNTAFCSLTTAMVTSPPYAAYAAEATAVILHDVPFGGTRLFSVAAGSSTTFRLICGATGAGVSVRTPVLTALFVAGP